MSGQYKHSCRTVNDVNSMSKVEFLNRVFVLSKSVFTAGHTIFGNRMIFKQHTSFFLNIIWSDMRKTLILVVRSRRLTKHLHRLAIFLFVKLHGYIECIQKFFSGSRFVKQRIISNQAVSFQRIGVKGFNSILRQQSIIVANIL